MTEERIHSIRELLNTQKYDLAEQSLEQYLQLEPGDLDSGRYFKRCRKKETNLTGHCAKCHFGTICKAGCTAMAISRSNSIGDNPYCVHHLEEQRILNDHFL